MPMARAQALVALVAATGVRGVGIDDRLWLPDRLGQHEPYRNPWAKQPAALQRLMTSVPLSVATLIMLRHCGRP
jgi:hypothetical protein